MSSNKLEIEVQITNADGLHMRPAMQFVDVASKYKCNIKVSNADTVVDGKSIMQMTMLAATQGTKLKISADGKDAEQAIEELKDLIEVKFAQQAQN